jgi:hypothetical protein
MYESKLRETQMACTSWQLSNRSKNQNDLLRKAHFLLSHQSFTTNTKYLLAPQNSLGFNTSR